MTSVMWATQVRSDYICTLGSHLLENLFTRNPDLPTLLEVASEALIAEQAFAIVHRPPATPEECSAIDSAVEQEGILWNKRKQANSMASVALINAITDTGSGVDTITPMLELDAKALTGVQRRRILSASKMFGTMLGCNIGRGQHVKVTTAKTERSYYDDSDNSIHLAHTMPWIVWHELGHWLEHAVPGAEDVAKAYLSSRTEGTPEKLTDLNPSKPGYSADETAYVAKTPFIEPYLGKADKDGTELTSMGMQFLYEDPGKLWALDRDFLNFILGMICIARLPGGAEWLET